jgi:hypothetical protein
MNESGQTSVELEVVLILVKVFSAISLLASMLVIWIYCYFKEQRIFYHEVILWFSITNALYSITSFLPYSANEIGPWCGLQSFTLNWFQDAGYMWSAIVGYTGFISVIKRDHLEKNRFKYRMIFLFIAFVISGAISSVYLILLK